MVGFFVLDDPQEVSDNDGNVAYAVLVRCFDPTINQTCDNTYVLESEPLAHQFIREVNYDMEGMTIE
jgi:hypothetical protein